MLHLIDMETRTLYKEFPILQPFQNNKFDIAYKGTSAQNRSGSYLGIRKIQHEIILRARITNFLKVYPFACKDEIAPKPEIGNVPR